MVVDYSVLLERGPKSVIVGIPLSKLISPKRGSYSVKPSGKVSLHRFAALLEWLPCIDEIYQLTVLLTVYGFFRRYDTAGNFLDRELE
jgi:hypothetical protein